MNMFSKRHYQAIADVLKLSSEENQKSDDNYKFGALGETRIIAHRLAAKFQADNPDFDRERFLKACGLSD